MPKISVLANCQAFPIQVMMKEVVNEIEYLPVPPIYSILGKDEKIDKIYSALSASDFIITQPLYHPGFQKLTLNNLKTEFADKLIIMPVIYYQGDYPELFYLKDFQKAPLRDFISHYFDWNVLISYLQGNPLEFTSGLLYRENFYSSSLLKSVRDDSLNALREKEQECSVIISDFIEENNASSEGLFWTMNHPKNRVLYKMADRIIVQLGYKGKTVNKREKEFLDNAQMPRYSVKSARKMAYRAGGSLHSRDEMVKMFYAYFDRKGNELLEFNVKLAKNKNPATRLFIDEISDTINSMAKCSDGKR